MKSVLTTYRRPRESRPRSYRCGFVASGFPLSRTAVRDFRGESIARQINLDVGSAVPYSPTAFHRLLEPLDRRVIARAVAAHGGDHGVGRGDHAWTCERYLKSLLFCASGGVDQPAPDRHRAGRQ
jgi:hypothetical protein